MERLETYFEHLEGFLEFLDSERVIYTFVLVWALAGVVWIVLDWLANPNRGGFKPTRDRRARGFKARRAHRRIKKAQRDAAVRATLRDAYGVSSLRSVWSRDREARSLAADNRLVHELPPSAYPRRKRKLLIRLREHRPADHGAQTKVLLATLDGDDPAILADGSAGSPEPLRPRGRWRLGLDPLMLSPDGRPPNPRTLRSRVWKNCADRPIWGVENRARMSAGKPPVRWHPIHGEQTAFVNLMSTQPCWPDTSFDPFSPRAPAELPAAEPPDNAGTNDGADQAATAGGGGEAAKTGGGER